MCYLQFVVCRLLILQTYNDDCYLLSVAAHSISTPPTIAALITTPTAVFVVKKHVQTPPTAANLAVVTPFPTLPAVEHITLQINTLHPAAVFPGASRVITNRREILTRLRSPWVVVVVLR